MASEEGTFSEPTQNFSFQRTLAIIESALERLSQAIR